MLNLWHSHFRFVNYDSMSHVAGVSLKRDTNQTGPISEVVNQFNGPFQKKRNSNNFIVIEVFFVLGIHRDSWTITVCHSFESTKNKNPVSFGFSESVDKWSERQIHFRWENILRQSQSSVTNFHLFSFPFLVILSFKYGFVLCGILWTGAAYEVNENFYAFFR